MRLPSVALSATIALAVLATAAPAAGPPTATVANGKAKVRARFVSGCYNGTPQKKGDPLPIVCVDGQLPVRPPAKGRLKVSPGTHLTLTFSVKVDTLRVSFDAEGAGAAGSATPTNATRRVWRYTLPRRKAVRKAQWLIMATRSNPNRDAFLAAGLRW